MNVDRIYVSKFHNGKLDINGVHFIYFSRVSEVTGPGISNELTRTQNLPLAIFPEMLTPLSRGECYYIKIVDVNVENAGFLSDMGVNSRMVCPIKNLDGKLIGIIGIDGVRNQINTQEAAQLEINMVALSTVLGGLLAAQ